MRIRPGILAAGMLVTTGLPASATVAVQTLPSVSVIVLNPDGTPAKNALGVATVIDGITSATAARPSYFFRADDMGTLTATIPLSDPYVAAHQAQARLFNVQLNLYTYSPGAKWPSAFHTVHYQLNHGLPGVPADRVGVDGQVIELVPLPARQDEAPLENPEWRYPEEAYCTNNTVLEDTWTCHTVSHPASLRAERIDLAHNVGAGIDMKTTFTVTGTVKETTTTVTGVDGLFVEARGSTSIGTSATDQFTFSSSTASGNEDPGVYVDFAWFFNYGCLMNQCWNTETTLPDHLVGPAGLGPTSEPIYHDYARDPGPTNFDCTIKLEGTLFTSRGVNREETWRIGFDFEGQHKAFTLHVNSVKQTEVSSDYQNSYQWEITGNSLPFHHVFVRGGHLGVDADTASTCPTHSPGSTWTDAADHDKSNPAPPPVPDTPPAADPVREPAEYVADDGRRQAGRCAAAPERCGQG